MAKELLLYTGLSSYSCEALIKSIDDNMDEEIVLRVNSPGGNVFDSWGVFAKIVEHGNVTAKVDGMAASGAANLLLYAKKAESSDISRFLLHRADGYVDTPEQQKLLNDINSDLRKKFEARVTTEKFKEVTGYSIDDLFNPETRINVWLTAKQMKNLGMISKINKLEPAEEKAMAQAMAHWSFKIAADADPEPIQTHKKVDMNIEKLRAEFPAVYAQIVAEGEKAGIKKEQERVGAWMAYINVDAKKVTEAINKGEELTIKSMAEFQVSMQSAEYLAKLQKDSAKDVSTETSSNPDVSADAKAKELTAFEKEVNSFAGLKKTA